MVIMETKKLPVKPLGEFFVSIGDRLKEERERLGFTQPAFAGLAETTKKSQIDYEKNLTQPKAGYFAAISKVGADIQYIVTGVRSVAALSADETELLKLFRAAPLAVKAAAMAALAAGSAPTSTKFVVHGDVAHQVDTVSGGNFIVNMGKR